MTELWDLYDGHKNSLGRTAERGSRLAQGEFHLVVNILSVGKDGRILVTQRHPDKPLGGKWEITGGSVLAGESSYNGAKRELFEETGLKADELDFRGTIIRPQTNTIHDLYLYKGDFDGSDIVLQEGETVNYRLLSPEELYSAVKRGHFLDYLYNRIKCFYPDILGDDLK